MRRLSAAVAAVVLSSCGVEEDVVEPVESTNQFNQQREAVTCAPTIVINKELMVTHLNVVEDPVRTVWAGATTGSDGAWHFGRLMTAMAGTKDPSTFVLNWLNQWTTDRTVNGFTVSARTAMSTQVINPWLTASGGTKLDLKKAPFRLLAIVNRLDLKNLSAGSAGEGRFVFGVTDPQGNALPFTVILEYRLPAVTEADAKQWAEQWHALSTMTLGGANYRTALEALTNRFAAKNAEPTRTNGSAINQVRTNEIALAAPWQLREFRLSASTGNLAQSTVAQTPDESLNNTPALRDFINANTTSILAGTHVVPLTFNSAKFRGGATPAANSSWNAAGITNSEARFLFSVNTCNGCHTRETNTTFLHVSTRAQGATSSLSGFLNGVTVTDPVTGAPRTLNDLAARSTKLQALLCSNPPQAICGLFRGGNSEALNMIASPNPEGSYGTTTADCIAYCDASGAQALDTCQYGQTWATRVIVKTY